MDTTNNQNMGVAVREANNGNMGASFALVNKRGKALGDRFQFVGQSSAKTLREAGKAKGLKGAALSKFVNASLTGDAAKASQVLVTAFVAHCHNNGVVFTHSDVRGSSVCIRGSKPKAESDKAVKGKVASLEAEKLALAEQVAQLKLQLAAGK